MILGPSGQPISSARPEPQFEVTRQLRRAYLRIAAISVINQKHGPEPRRLRRALALQLAKRPAFIAEVRKASGAW